MEEGDDSGIFMCMQHYSSKVCFMIRQSKITNKQISKYCRLQSSRPISLVLTHRRILFGGRVSFRLQWAFNEQWPVLHPGVHWQRKFKLFSFFNMQTWVSKASSRKLVLSWCLCDAKTTHTKKKSGKLAGQHTIYRFYCFCWFTLKNKNSLVKPVWHVERALPIILMFYWQSENLLTLRTKCYSMESFIHIQELDKCSESKRKCGWDTLAKLNKSSCQHHCLVLEESVF